MLSFNLLFDGKKEVLIGFSLSLLYITYYLVEVVKVPLVVCGSEELGGVVRALPALAGRYWPTPWCVEARLQTVLGSLLRSLLLPAVRYQRQVLALADGGTVALDWTVEGEEALGQQGNDRPVLLLLPGLTGGSQADYARCLTQAARALGARCVVFNQRGLGGLPLTSPRLYCAVSHADLAEVVRAVRARAGPRAPLLAVGVSLGGLILGQYLAAQGDRADLAAAFVVSSPLDVEKASECMERWPLNALLSYHMARNLRQTVAQHARLHAAAAADAGSERAEGWDWAAVRRCRSVREFDAAFTTKHFGFGSVEQYYRAASLRDKLHAVRVPLLCLQAADDPFQPIDALPLREVAASRHVALAVPARGGHIGFLQGWWPLGDQYMATVAHQYFAALLASPALLHTSTTTTTTTTTSAAHLPVPSINM